MDMITALNGFLMVVFLVKIFTKNIRNLFQITNKYCRIINFHNKKIRDTMNKETTSF